MLLDYHAHYCLFNPECTTVNPDEDKNVEAMMAAGVKKICLSGSNVLVEKLWKKYPDFIIPFIYVRPGTEKPEVITKYMKKGFKGVKFHLPKWPYDNEKCFKYYEIIEKNKLHTLFHTAISYGAGDPFHKKIKFSSDFTRPMTLDRVARCFPDMIIVGSHLGYPWFGEALGLTNWFPNTYWDLCLGQVEYFKDGKPLARPVIKQFYDEGWMKPEKTLYGSDSMFERKADLFKGNLDWATRTIKLELEVLEMKQEEKEWVCYKTAEKILGIKI